MKLQSAMEYLMTYGWALLILVIVMIAMFELNLFNPNTYASKAPPGSCIVIRSPTGGASLSSACDNLEPKFVAQFTGISSSVVSIPDTQLLNPNSVTVAAWFSLVNPSTNQRILAKYGGVGGDLYGMYYNTPNFGSRMITPLGTNYYQVSYSILPNTFYFGAVTYNSNSNTVALYMNGVLLGTSATTSNGPLIYYSSPLTIAYSPLYGYMTGSEADVQVYNTSLSANSIQALYMEGIGGAPINLQNLVGWWPLNDNANDYSGNGNNGAAANVFYTASWTNGYTQP